MSNLTPPVRLALLALALLLTVSLLVFAYFDHTLKGVISAQPEVMNVLRSIFLKGGFIMLLAAFSVVFWLIYRFYARLEVFQQFTRKIVQSGDLSSRLPVSSGEEFAIISSDLNAVLERTQKLAQGVRQAGDSIAHDLRTPLTRMRTDVEVALQESNPEGWHATLERVLVEVGGMQSTFNSLLALGQAEAGGMRLKAKEVDISKLLEEVSELYIPSAEEHDLKVETDIAPDLKIMGDKQLLAQTYSNLFDNAIKYVPAGGIIKLSAKLAGKKLEITMEDNGPGIPQEMRDKVFERFTRIDPSRTLPGTGLGLALVKAFVELHRGVIKIDQSQMGGAAFIITLPLQ